MSHSEGYSRTGELVQMRHQRLALVHSLPFNVGKPVFVLVVKAREASVALKVLNSILFLLDKKFEDVRESVCFGETTSPSHQEG